MRPKGSRWRPLRFKEPTRDVWVACPACSLEIFGRTDLGPSHRRRRYASHLRVAHYDLSVRVRSELADRMLKAERPRTGTPP